MKLHVNKLGEGRPLIVLHGLLGSGRNWRHFAQSKLAQYFHVHLVDLRNHGQSGHSHNATLTAMADDIVELLDEHDLPSAHFVGHSLGGRVILTLAALHPEKLERTVIVDIGPQRYPPHHGSILRALKDIQLHTFASRDAVFKALSPEIPDSTTLQFILQNLKRSDEGHYQWRIPINILYENYSELIDELDIPCPCALPILFVRGGQSDYLPHETFPKISQTFKNATYATIEQAGHLIHFEQPEALAKLILSFLQPTTIEPS